MKLVSCPQCISPHPHIPTSVPLYLLATHPQIWGRNSHYYFEGGSGSSPNHRARLHALCNRQDAYMIINLDESGYHDTLKCIHNNTCIECNEKGTHSRARSDWMKWALTSTSLVMVTSSTEGNSFLARRGKCEFTSLLLYDVTNTLFWLNSTWHGESTAHSST